MLNRFIQRAPENFLGREQIRDVRAGRRGFLAGAFSATAVGVMAAGQVRAQTAAHANGVAGAGADEILNLPAHSKGLGQPVAARGYGLPSEWE